MPKQDVSGRFSKYSLSKVVDDPVVDVEGRITTEFGFPMFRVQRIIFASGLYCLVDGAHEAAFINEPLDVAGLDEKSLLELENRAGEFLPRPIVTFQLTTH